MAAREVAAPQLELLLNSFHKFVGFTLDMIRTLESAGVVDRYNNVAGEMNVQVLNGTGIHLASAWQHAHISTHVTCQPAGVIQLVIRVTRLAYLSESHLRKVSGYPCSWNYPACVKVEGRDSKLDTRGYGFSTCTFRRGC